MNEALYHQSKKEEYRENLSWYVVYLENLLYQKLYDRPRHYPLQPKTQYSRRKRIPMSEVMCVKLLRPLQRRVVKAPENT